ncbi:hypothetical protein RF11_07989 [Thelohanellus kitauei]|uniref:Uncharacterized protein n=1 Tax=Thelohanellus kitauei TaxID=669202 RepID=A0A0C2JLI8_THEKT|nr:hypothetical protein RF11_07989 [Thelohanellus kitauei]
MKQRETAYHLYFFIIVPRQNHVSERMQNLSLKFVNEDFKPQVEVARALMIPKSTVDTIIKEMRREVRGIDVTKKNDMELVTKSGLREPRVVKKEENSKYCRAPTFNNLNDDTFHEGAQRSVNTEVFNTFFSATINVLNEAEEFIFVLDNRIQIFLNKYLPHYSLILNKREEAFALIKSTVCRISPYQIPGPYFQGEYRNIQHDPTTFGEFH